jgi:hypothetical protein
MNYIEEIPEKDIDLYTERVANADKLIEAQRKKDVAMEDLAMEDLGKRAKALNEELRQSIEKNTAEIVKAIEENF